MEKGILKCSDCEQPMLEIGGIGKGVQLGEYVGHPDSETATWRQTGVREIKLYQCPKCKCVKLI